MVPVFGEAPAPRRSPLAGARLWPLPWVLGATIALISVAAQADPTPRALRRTSLSLISAFDHASFDPPLPARPNLARCTSRQLHAAWQNPFSTLDQSLGQRHLRLTQVTGPSRVSYRDSFLIETGHTVSFDIIPEGQPRLEFGWRLLPCSDRGVTLSVEVTVHDRHGSATRIEPLVAASISPSENGRTYRDFNEFTLPLALVPGQAARLSLRLIATFPSGKENPQAMVALAEPALTGIALPTTDEAATAPRRPPLPGGKDINLLWIVIDAVRHDAVGPGRTFDAPEATPTLDGLFRDGTSFRNAYSLANQTRTSTVGMLSSAVPSIGGFHSNTWALEGRGLKRFYESDPPLVPLILEKAGWRVAHYGHNFFLFAGEEVGVDHGFPYAVDFTGIPSDAIDASEQAIRFFEDHRDRRWALLLNYTAPHTPYKPPEAFADKAAAIPGPERLGGLLPRNYLGELMWVDHNLTGVLARLESLGLADNTLVIVTADHGEVMSPAHDCFSAIVGQPCSFNHSLTLYNDELHVPLAIRLPGQIAPGRVVDGPISHADLGPTILDFLGLPPDPRHGGRSQRAALQGGEVEPSPVLADGRMASAFIHEGYKLIVHAAEDDIAPRARSLGPDQPLARRELFNLVDDPGETVNLAVREKGRLEEMMAALKGFRAELSAVFTKGRAIIKADAGPVNAGRDEGAPAPGAAPVVVTLRLEHKGELVYRAQLVESDGRPVDASEILTCAAAGVTCTAGPTGGVAGRLDVPEGGHKAVSFLMGPAAFGQGRTIQWSLSLDGVPFPAERLRLGRFGLAFFQHKPSPTVRELFTVAATATQPFVQPREQGLYLTIVGALPGTAASAKTRVAAPTVLPDGDGPVAPEDAVYDGRADSRLGRDMRRVLRDLGYSR